MTLIRITLAEPNQFLSCSRPTLLVLCIYIVVFCCLKFFLMPFAIQRLGCFECVKMIQGPRENTLVPLNRVYSGPRAAPISQHSPFLPAFPPQFYFCCDGLAEGEICHFQEEMPYSVQRKLDIPRMWSKLIDSPGL